MMVRLWPHLLVHKLSVNRQHVTYAAQGWQCLFFFGCKLHHACSPASGDRPAPIHGQLLGNHLKKTFCKRRGKVREKGKRTVKGRREEGAFNTSTIFWPFPSKGSDNRRKRKKNNERHRIITIGRIDFLLNRLDPNFLSPLPVHLSPPTMDHSEPPPPYRLQEDDESKAAAVVSAVLTPQGIPLAALSSQTHHPLDDVDVDDIQPPRQPRPTTSSSMASSASSASSSGYTQADPMMARSSSHVPRPYERSTAARKSTLDPAYGPGCCFSETGGCCFSQTNGCCFSSSSGCCFSDTGGCCFSESEGCCFSSNGACCFSEGK